MNILGPVFLGTHLFLLLVLYFLSDNFNTIWDLGLGLLVCLFLVSCFLVLFVHVWFDHVLLTVGLLRGLSDFPFVSVSDFHWEALEISISLEVPCIERVYFQTLSVGGKPYAYKFPGNIFFFFKLQAVVWDWLVSWCCPGTPLGGCGSSQPWVHAEGSLQPPRGCVCALDFTHSFT